jgi:hypothetical protein
MLASRGSLDDDDADDNNNIIWRESEVGKWNEKYMQTLKMLDSLVEAVSFPFPSKNWKNCRRSDGKG